MAALPGVRRPTPLVVLAVAFVALVAIAAVVRIASQPPPTRVLAFYSTGQATALVDAGPPFTLALAERGARLLSPGGVDMYFTSPDGWALDIRGPYSFGTDARPQEIESRGSISLEYPRRTEFFDTTACTFAYTEMIATHVAGSVRCRGLVWLNASVERVKPLDLPPFDLDVTFEATGDGTLPTPTPITSRRPAFGE
jgi:hypothetical protein